MVNMDAVPPAAVEKLVSMKLHDAAELLNAGTRGQADLQRYILYK
jgi:hypothetical protein